MTLSCFTLSTGRAGYLATIMMAGCVSLLSGCATLSKQECLSGNWQAIGFTDGAAGRPADYLSSHNKACSKVGVATDYAAWEQGRQEGLKKYCTETHAYQIGRRGEQMTPVCPAQVTPNLERINADGRSYYSLSKQLTIEQERLNSYQQQYDKLLKRHNVALSSQSKVTDYQNGLSERIKNTTQRINNLERVLQELQRTYGY